MKKVSAGVLVLLLVFVLSLGAVSAQSDLGTEANPIQVFFVPSVEAKSSLPAVKSWQPRWKKPLA